MQKSLRFALPLLAAVSTLGLFATRAAATNYQNTTSEPQILLIATSKYKDGTIETTKIRWTDHGNDSWEVIGSETESTGDYSSSPTEYEQRTVAPGEWTYIEDFEANSYNSAENGGMDRISETTPEGWPIFEEKWTYKSGTEYVSRTYQVM